MGNTDLVTWEGVTILVCHCHWGLGGGGNVSGDAQDRPPIEQKKPPMEQERPPMSGREGGRKREGGREVSERGEGSGIGEGKGR